MQGRPAITAARGNVLGYVRGHWRGEQSLARSFWINLALLRIGLFVVETTAQPVLSDSLGDTAPLAVAGLLLADLAIFVWQTIGVVRACDGQQSSYGSAPSVWVAYLGILIALIVALVGAFTLLQDTFHTPNHSNLSEDWERERAAKYDLTLSGDRVSVALDGSIELGLTKRLEAILQQHPGVTRILLASQGGNIYESRGVARLIQEHGLETIVLETCSSACTVAFVAGAQRSLGPLGRLGFHQYGIEADYHVPFVDVSAEQATDRAFFQSQGISDAFLERIFDSPAADLWFPSLEELLAAGVVHGIQEGNQ